MWFDLIVCSWQVCCAYTDSYGRLCGDGPVPQRGGDICSTLAGQQLCENGRCVSTADGSSFRCECLQGYKPSPGETTRCTGAHSTPQHSVCPSVCPRRLYYYYYYCCYYYTRLTGFFPGQGGSVAEWLACWTQVLKGLGSNRSRDAVG